MMQRNPTHDPTVKSWLASANINGIDFPIQNLPFAVLRRRASHEAFRGAVAIGDQVLDLAALSQTNLLHGLAQQACQSCAQPTLNAFMAMGQSAWTALRHALFALLRFDALPAVQDEVQRCLIQQSAVEYGLPATIANYTDFYTSIHHARNVGRIAKPLDNDPLTPNFQWLPIAYHARASSVVVSGTAFHRPMGQMMPPGASAPVYGPCARLDYELELGIFIGPGNSLGEPIPLAQANEHIFGLCLLNDWSARDIQFWEMLPLGPFLGKNFCTTVSPWVVSLEALVPYRQPFERPAHEPQPLPYLDDAAHRAAGVLDIRLDVLLETNQQRAAAQAPSRLSHTSFKHQYWTFAQMVAQHTVGGCNLQSGDLLGSGTISGPTDGEQGAMIELTQAGRAPVTLPNGEQRGFLQDGDAVILKGWCEAPGAVRIGFGECRGEALGVRVLSGDKPAIDSV
jgi:fumarylacetoacetase